MATDLVLLHGFTQTAACWGPFGRHLAERHTVRALDAPGHGAAADLDLDLWGSAEHALACGGSAAYLGYSMGGRVALHAALSSPHLVRALVLVGATAGITDASERDARRRADDELADRIEAVGVPAFLDEWLAGPLFAHLPPDVACRRERETNTAEGLAASLRSVGTGVMEPLWNRVGELQMPVLVVAGEIDHKFRDIGQALVDAIGESARLEVVPGAGHAAHLEAPAATAALVSNWLDGAIGPQPS